MNRFGTYIVAAILFAVLALILVYGPLTPKETASYKTVEAIGSGTQNRWNEISTTSPTVLYDYETHLFRAWYVGIGTNNRSGIGYATSTDGIHWQANENPIMIAQDGWESKGFRDVHVVQDGGHYRMWYTAESDAGEKQIGYAISQNGIAWSKSAENPILTSGDDTTWDAHSVSEPFVLQIDGTWRMWFTGTDANGISRIGYATSTEGLRWSKAPINPVFSGQETWNAAGVSGAFVNLQFNGQLFELWFHGTPKGKKQVSSLGRAYSNDGITWAEDTESNPIVIADKTSFTNPWIANIDGVSYIWTGVTVTKPVAHDTIHFTSYPRKFTSGEHVLPTEVPAFTSENAY